MSIARNYAQPQIGRPNTLSSGGNLRSDRSPGAQFFRRVEKTAVPALKSVGKYGVKQLAKAGTSTFKPIGQGIGLAAGVGATLNGASSSAVTLAKRTKPREAKVKLTMAERKEIARQKREELKKKR